jgi:AAA+ superfamily predicted ATPase
LETQNNIITIGATNRPQDLDSALLSRFDTIIEFNEPDEADIREILAFFARQLTADENTKLAAQMQGLSVRAIRDVCLRAERQLAREQIEQGTAAGVPAVPTLAYYVRTLAEYRLGRPVT